MVRVVAFALFFVGTVQLSAQFGVRMSIQKNDYSNWNQIAQSSVEPTTDGIFNLSYELSVDYWFRLKNQRIEFYPLIGVGYSNSKNPTPSSELFPQSYKLSKGAIGLLSHVYLFDFKNDCKCPTFSKQNDLLKKGFFVLLGAKGNYQRKESVFLNQTRKHSDVALEIEAGLGLDIGISDLLTITPFFTTSFLPSNNWEGISNDHGIVNVLPPDETSSNVAFEIGVRVGFRPDYLNNR